MVPPHRSIRRYVLDDERIVLATRHHWARLVEPMTTAAVAFIVIWLLVGLGRQATGGRADLLWWAWAVVMARTALRVVGWRVEWFVATDRRMLLLTGIVTQRVAMMPLHKVTDMSYRRSVPGRLLGYGEFVLESAGQDQAMRCIAFVPSPDRSYRTLCETIFAPAGAAVQQTATTRSRVPAPAIPPVIPPTIAPVIPGPSAWSQPARAVPVTQAIPVVDADERTRDAGGVAGGGRLAPDDGGAGT